MKRLGQHFLKNRQKLKKIADSLDLKGGETVVEIGAGHGELTRMLLAVPNVKVIAIEKDKNLIKELEENFKFLISNFETNSNNQNSKLKIIHGDALKILPSVIRNSCCKIAGNIPFYITGQLFRVLGDLITNYQLPITTIVLTVQKEVAKRICAKPPRMNLLAASVQFWADPEIVGFIPKKDFKPQPEVDAAILRLTSKQKLGKGNYQLLITNYYKLIKVLFKQPRKTILNNLSALKPKEEVIPLLKKLRINPTDRPQDLAVATLKTISSFL